MAANFAEMTGISVEDAGRWLEMAGGDVGFAMDMFFSSGGAPPPVTEPAAEEPAAEESAAEPEPPPEGLEAMTILIRTFVDEHSESHENYEKARSSFLRLVMGGASRGAEMDPDQLATEMAKLCVDDQEMHELLTASVKANVAAVQDSVDCSTHIQTMSARGSSMMRPHMNRFWAIQGVTTECGALQPLTAQELVTIARASQWLDVAVKACTDTNDELVAKHRIGIAMAQLLLQDSASAELNINLALTLCLGREGSPVTEFTARLVHGRVLLSIAGREQDAAATLQALSAGEATLISKQPEPLHATLLANREQQLVKVVTNSRLVSQLVKQSARGLSQDAPGLAELLNHPIASAALGASGWVPSEAVGAPPEDPDSGRSQASVLPNGSDGSLLPLYLHAGIMCPFEMVQTQDKAIWEYQNMDQRSMWWEPYAPELSRTIEAAHQSVNRENPTIEVSPGVEVLININFMQQISRSNGRMREIRRREVKDPKDVIEALPFGVGELWGLSAAACMHPLEVQQMLGSVAGSDEATEKLLKLRNMGLHLFMFEQQQLSSPVEDKRPDEDKPLQRRTTASEATAAESLAKHGCTNVADLHQLLQSEPLVIDPWADASVGAGEAFALQSKWVNSLGGELSLIQAAQDWTKAPPALLTRLMSEAISVDACAELVGVTEWKASPDDRFQALVQEAFSPIDTFSQKSAVRVLANVMAYLWHNGKQQHNQDCCSALIMTAISAVSTIAEQDEGVVCAPDQGFCIIKTMLCRIASNSNKKIKASVAVHVKAMLVQLLQATQSHLKLQWLTELSTQALWQMLLPEEEDDETVSPETAELLKLPDQLQRTGLCDELSDLTTNFTLALEISKEILDGRDRGKAFLEACVGDYAPEGAAGEETVAAWVSPQFIFNSASQSAICPEHEQILAAANRNKEKFAEIGLSEETSESLEMMSTMGVSDYMNALGATEEDATLLARVGKGCKQKAESEALQAALRATFSALLWHTRPLELLQSPEAIQVQVRDSSWPKRLYMLARQDVDKWLQEHKSPGEQEQTSGLQRTPSVHGAAVVSSSAAGVIQRAKLLLNLHSATYLQFADSKALDELAEPVDFLTETVHLSRTASCPTGRVTVSPVKDLDRLAVIRQLTGTTDDEAEVQSSHQKAIVAVLMPQGSDEPVKVDLVVAALRFQQDWAAQLIAAYKELLVCLQGASSEGETKKRLSEAMVGVLGTDIWLHPMDTCKGCGLLQESRLCKSYQELVAELIAASSENVARIATLWSAADIEFVARMELPSRLIELATKSGTTKIAANAWKLAKSLVMLASKAEKSQFTKQVHNAVVKSVLEHLHHTVSTSVDEQKAHLDKYGIAPLCLLALCLPAESEATPAQPLRRQNTTFEASWIGDVVSTLIKLCLEHPGWDLSQGAFALFLRVLRQLSDTTIADAVAREWFPEENGLAGSAMVTMLVKLAYTDDSNSKFSTEAREVFGEMATAAIVSLRRIATWQPPIDDFLSGAMEVGVANGRPSPLSINNVANEAAQWGLSPDYASQIHATSLALQVMGGQSEVIRSGAEALGPGGLVLVTHYELGDSKTDVLSLPKLNALDTVQLTELEPRVSVTVLGTHLDQLLEVVRWHLDKMNDPNRGRISEDECLPISQGTLAIKALSTHMTQLPEQTAQALADTGLAWDLVQAAQDAQLAGQCNIDDSIQVLELLANQVLLPIATGHDRRKQLPTHILINLTEVSMGYGAPLSVVTELFTDAGGVEEFDKNPSMLNGVKAKVVQHMDMIWSGQKTEKPVDPELLRIMEEFETNQDGMSTSGSDPDSLPELDTIPVRQETMEELGMQSVPSGVGKMELSAKHALIQKLLRGEEEVWRTAPKLFLARVYQRLAKLHALRAASKLLQHWPSSVAIEVSSVSRVLMLVYRCVACGMQQDQLMGCISAIVAKDNCGDTSAELIKAARHVSRMFVTDHVVEGKTPQDAALNVALAIFSASAKQTDNPAVAAELLQASTLRHLISVAQLSVGPQRRTLLRLLSQVVAEMPDVLTAVDSSDHWASLWAGLRAGFGGAFQQTMDTPGGTELGSLTLQSYTELFFSVRKALQRAELVHKAVPRTVALTADTPPSGLSDSDQALARFMCVADGAMAFLHGTEPPLSLTLGVVGDWRGLVQIMHCEDARVLYTHPAAEPHGANVWGLIEYQQLAKCLEDNECTTEVLPCWLETGKWAEFDMIRYPRIRNETHELLQSRSLMLTRFSSLMMSVMPLLDMFSKVETTAEMAAIRQMRGLLLGKDKSQLIAGLLDQCKRARTGNEQLRGQRGTWADVTVDRIGAIPGNSMFRQVFNDLRSQDLVTLNDMFRGAVTQMWYVKFTGEEAWDWGGVFREFYSVLGGDVCSNMNELLIQVPNLRDQEGYNQDTWIPNPSCQALDQFEFLGRLMAFAVLTDESLEVNFPPIFWKQIAGVKINPTDLNDIDVLWCNKMKMFCNDEGDATMDLQDGHGVRPLTADEFEDYLWQPWTVVLSNQTVVDLVPGASSPDADPVAFEDRKKYVDKCYKKRIDESSTQVEAIRRGMTSIIPIQVLKLWTAKQFEFAVGGDRVITVEALKENVVWDIDSQAPVVEFLWQAIERMDNDERALLLRFTTGRSRMPIKLKISQLDKGPDALPEAHTCFWQLCLPNYPDVDTAYAKIRLAIYNCVEMDIA